jgi:hypothetical protein
MADAEEPTAKAEEAAEAPAANEGAAAPPEAAEGTGPAEVCAPLCVLPLLFMICWCSCSRL